MSREAEDKYLLVAPQSGGNEWELFPPPSVGRQIELRFLARTQKKGVKNLLKVTYL
jgi:hypothetical protein